MSQLEHVEQSVFTHCFRPATTLEISAENKKWSEAGRMATRISLFRGCCSDLHFDPKTFSHEGIKLPGVFLRSLWLWLFRYGYRDSLISEYCSSKATVLSYSSSALCSSFWVWNFHFWKQENIITTHGNGKQACGGDQCIYECCSSEDGNEISTTSAGLLILRTVYGRPSKTKWNCSLFSINFLFIPWNLLHFEGFSMIFLSSTP